MSGNYRLRILDDEETVASVDFMVTEQTMILSLEATTNTDIDLNQSHQQLSVSLNYNGTRVTNPDEQIFMVVMQNGRTDNQRSNIQPTFRNSNGLDWKHVPDLIFDAGNEYHKFEILDPSHPTMGIDRITWDGDNYQAYPFIDEPRRNYIYDEICKSNLKQELSTPFLSLRDLSFFTQPDPWISCKDGDPLAFYKALEKREHYLQTKDLTYIKSMVGDALRYSEVYDVINYMRLCKELDNSQFDQLCSSAR